MTLTDVIANLAHHTSDAVLIAHAEPSMWPGPRIVWCNPSFTEMTGFSSEEIIGQTPRILQGADTSGETKRKIREALLQWRPVRAEILNYRKSGEPFWVDLNIQPVADSRGWYHYWVAIQRDITSSRQLGEQLQFLQDATKKQNGNLKRLASRIRHDARHDRVTGLPNRAWLEWRHRKITPPLQDPPNSPNSLFAIDIDDFANINGAYGHRVGDAVLKALANRLRAFLRPDDIVCRGEGDEFLIYVAVSGDEARRTFAQSLSRFLSEPLKISGHSINLGVAIGFTSTRAIDRSIETLVNRASLALKRAKISKERVLEFSSGLEEDIRNLRWFASELPRALQRQEFVPYYQVQISVETWAVEGVEALIRWEHPDLGVLGPDKFLEAARALHRLDEIEDVVLDRIVRDHANWVATELAIERISVNVSASRLLDPSFTQRLVHVKATGTPIAVELLETSITDDIHDQVNPALLKLKNAGIKIEVDDFGTGHASVLGLIRLKPDGVKIDRHLIPQNTDDTTLIEAAASLIFVAKAAGAHVIAEGIEKLSQAQHLIELGCDALQGWLFGQAVPARDLALTVSACQKIARPNVSTTFKNTEQQN